MNPSRTFILRPVATALLTAAVLLAGGVAYTQLPISALPQVDYPTIQVLTFYPGASPDVIASSVTSPLERQFGQLPGLKQMTSTSSFGASLITLQFVLEYQIDVAEQQVQAAIHARPGFPAAQSANPADLQQGEPGRRADPDAGAHVRRAAALPGARPRGHEPGAEDLAAPGGRARQSFRRSEAGRARADGSDEARVVRAQPGRRARRAVAGQRGPGEGQPRRAAAGVHDRRERS